MGPHRARRIARLSRIGARLMYGPIRDPTASPRALRASSGSDGPPADRRQHRWAKFHRSFPGLGGPQLLLVQPMLLVFSNDQLVSDNGRQLSRRTVLVLLLPSLMRHPNPFLLFVVSNSHVIVSAKCKQDKHGNTSMSKGYKCESTAARLEHINDAK